MHINIANDHEHLSPGDIRHDTTPSTFVSTKTGRGLLGGSWRDTCQPVMCAYKLVTFYFKWFGLQNIVENYGHKV